jgi:hypothetical protein
MFSVNGMKKGMKNNAYFLGLMPNLRLELNKVTDQEETTTDKKSTMEKVRTFYHSLYRKKILTVTS